ncbi:MAG: class I SAM-dependent DNA methyltransferase [Shimia sp.]
MADQNDDPSLRGAYGAEGTDALRTLYHDWADTYDSAFVRATGYVLHVRVAAAFAAAGGTGPVLDIGAGTGLVAEALRREGVAPIDGVDLSPEMLAKAAAKGLYRRTYVADITEPTALPRGAYSGIVSAGTFTLGHLGPSALMEVLATCAPGALLTISVNAAHWEAAGFEQAVRDLSGVREVSRQDAAIYDGSKEHPNVEDQGLILTLRA